MEKLTTSVSTVTVTDRSLDTLSNNESVGPNFSQVTSNTSDSKYLVYDETRKQSDPITNTVEPIYPTFKEIIPFTETQLASLYVNQELKLVDAFISEFTEVQLRSNGIRQQHKLYELLMSYLRVRNHLIINSHELEALKKSCREMQKQLWCLDKACITEAGECQDGNPVVATHEYCTARFSQQTFGILARKLSTVKELLHSTQALYSYEAEVLKLQIEHYIQRVCMSCKDFTNMSQNAPANLFPMHGPSQTIPQLVEIRMCITILFNFQRKLLKDGKFVTDTREWLTRLVAILLKLANWQDHLFLLNHILRCPGGVMNWACSYVQTPVPQHHGKISVSPFNDPHLDHVIATLAVILLPIKDRDKFLEQVFRL